MLFLVVQPHGRQQRILRTGPHFGLDDLDRWLILRNSRETHESVETVPVLHFFTSLGHSDLLLARCVNHQAVGDKLEQRRVKPPARLGFVEAPGVEP